MEENMQLFVAGVIHHDPLGRNRVENWLSELLLQHDELPGFVAVEWDETILARVVSQRSSLAKRAKAQWPIATTEFIQALADAMGYEGDSHSLLLPTVKTVWLDEGREPASPDDIERFAEFRMNTYKILAKDIQKFDMHSLELMSNAAWNNIQPREEGPNVRDEIFSKRLFAACEASATRWSIAILGLNHAIDSPESAIGLLTQNGISCHITKLAPSTFFA